MWLIDELVTEERRMLTQCAHIVALVPIRGRVAKTNCGSSLSDNFATIIRLQFVGSVVDS